MDSITTKLKIILTIIVLLVLIFAGWHLFKKQDNSRDSACRRAASQNDGPQQELSLDAAVCAGTAQPGNKQ